jgi:hypothetical protein
MSTSNTSNASDDFRIVDLFSPSETPVAPPDARDAAPPATSRVGGRPPESLVFTNPLFGSAPDAKRPH